MGKSIRSKKKRKHRAEFRRTIGTEAAEATSAVVQEKLRECVEKGSMNSFDRLSSLLNAGGGNDGDGDGMRDDDEVRMGANDDRDGASALPAIDAMDTSSGIGMGSGGAAGKRADKVPAKARSGGKKKHLIPNVAGQSGAKLARKIVSKARKRGQLRKVAKAVKTPTRKPRKKKNMCAF